MNVLFENVSWMTYNISLGIIAVVLGWFALKSRSKGLRLLFSFAWLLFIPNTIYMITDVTHFPQQFTPQEGLFKTIIFLQYTFLFFWSVETFVIGLYPMEKLFLEFKGAYRKIEASAFVVVVNFIIALGVVVGRVQRANSWDVILNPNKVIADTLALFYSHDLLLLIFFFWILNNVVYFSFRNILVRHTRFFVRTILHAT